MFRDCYAALSPVILKKTKSIANFANRRETHAWEKMYFLQKRQ